MDIIYLLIGTCGIPQLNYAVRSQQHVNPEATIIVYSDVIHALEYLKKQGVKLRKWSFKATEPSQAKHAKFATKAFANVTIEKIKVMLDALEKCGTCILFSDIDILALRSFEIDLSYQLKRFDLLVSCEGNKIAPSNFCTGLLAINKCEANMQLLKKWLDFHRKMLIDSPKCHDQNAFKLMLCEYPELEKQIKPLPNGYAMPGWFYNNYISLIERKMPTFFHFNWVVGAEEKERRMSIFYQAFIEKKSKALYLEILRTRFTEIKNFIKILKNKI